MKFINLSVSFKQATHLSKRIQIKFSKINTTMIIREVNRFTEGTLIIKMINTKNNKSQINKMKINFCRYKKVTVKSIKSH